MKGQPHTLAIGVTGGIGSGKTEVCRIFRSLGAKVLYADAIAKELIDSTSMIKTKIQEVFGQEIFKPDGKLDRHKMAMVVFNNKAMKEQLNGIVHPHVVRFLRQKINQSKQSRSHAIVVVEAALIYEAHAETLFDYIVVVDASEEQRIDRILKRGRTSRADVIGRIKAQMSAEEKLKKADFIINNSGTLRSLKVTCKFLYQLLLRLTNTRVNSQRH
ncbi:MAG: dephospho-CoA kinase [Ignavibacteriae bacterium]|nr:dephospho-CoA kinase [Ignavibacteriota bacterium]